MTKQVEQILIRKTTTFERDVVEEYCSICKDREIYKEENKPIIKIIGDTSCHYCGGQILLCKKHWGLFEQQLKNANEVNK